MPDGLNPQVIPFNAGTYVNLYALGIRYLVRGAQTAGRLSIVEHPLPPRALGSPVHTHSREDEISYVAEGLVGVQLGDQVFTAGPGDTIVKPRGIPHAFWNAGDTPARIAEIITPAGFEDYFEELAPILAEAGHAPPDPERIAPILARYGLSLDFSTVPILMERHGLRQHLFGSTCYELNVGEGVECSGSIARQSYLSDVSDDEWAFVAPHLTLLCEDALQLKHDLREVSNGLCWLVRTGADYERLHQTEAGPTFLAFTCLILHQLIHLPSSS